MSGLKIKDAVGTLVIGVAFGAVLHGIGFTTWDEVNHMFAFKDPRMTLTFGLCVGLMAGGWVVIKKLRHPKWSTRGIHKGTLVGGLLFGVGWALTGGCPSIAFAQLGEGQFPALLTLVGIFIGNAIYAAIHQRYLKWDTGNCLDD
jgi:uncharacterized membrane protein YedE/YeeE